MAEAIAVIGASRHRHKFGNKAVRAFLQKGYTVCPVNPNETEVEGLPAFARVSDIAEPVELATLYLPPAAGLGVVEDLAAKGIRRVYLNPGASSPELVARLKARGIEPLEACSIVAIGLSPHDFPD